MSVETEQDERTEEGQDGSSGDPRVEAARAFGAGDRGREMLGHAAQGATLDEQEEGDALDYLLGAKPALQYEIEVSYATDKGLRRLWFITNSADTTRIDRIEERNMDEKTGRIDRLQADCEIVAMACAAIRGESGRVVEISSSEFRTLTRKNGDRDEVADASMALKLRFADQLGLINGVALEIKRTCGFSPERVKSAKRILQTAALD